MPTVRMKEVAQQRDAYVYVDVLRHLFGLNGAAGDAAPSCDLGVEVREPASEAPAGSDAAAGDDGPTCGETRRGPGR